MEHPDLDQTGEREYDPDEVDEERLRFDYEYRWEHAVDVIGFEREHWNHIMETERYLRPHLGEIVESLYERLMEFEPTAKFYLDDENRLDPEQYEHRVEGFVLWFERIFDWREDEQYVKYLKDVAMIHTERLGFEDMDVNPFYMAPTFGILFEEIMELIRNKCSDPDTVAQSAVAWQKFFSLQLNLMEMVHAPDSTDDK